MLPLAAGAVRLIQGTQQNIAVDFPHYSEDPLSRHSFVIGIQSEMRPRCRTRHFGSLSVFCGNILCSRRREEASRDASTSGGMPGFREKHLKIIGSCLLGFFSDLHL